jgi:ankyrin repeat protein
MVKFDSPEDPIYKKDIVPLLKTMVENAMKPRMTHLPNGILDMQQPRGISLGVLQTQEEITTPVFNTDLSALRLENVEQNNNATRSQNSGSFTLLSFWQGTTLDDATAWISSLARDLQAGIKRDFKDVKDALPGTCDWIRAKEHYQRWLNSPQNAVVFIQGGVGFGKSVLAKFLVREIANGRKVILTYYCSKQGARDNAKSILQGILAQIWLSSPTSFKKVALGIRNQFLQSSLDLEFYWALFTAVRSYLENDLICIIDGLDECIKSIKPERATAIDTKIVEFLRRICSLSDEECQQGQHATKVLFTTRSVAEVHQVVENRNFVLQIEPEDVADGVKRFISVRVKTLVAQRGLSAELESHISKRLIAKSGSKFQMAHLLLNLLSDSGYDLGSAAKIDIALERFNPNDIELPYIETIEKMQINALEKCAKVVRITFFAFRGLDLPDMTYALAVVPDDSSVDAFHGRIEEGLGFFLDTHCGILLSRDKEGIICFEHSAARDFFQTWTSNQQSRGMFSCAEANRGHLDMALLCIRFMLLWRQEFLSDQAESSGKDLTGTHPFLGYALQCWPLHVHEAGDWILPHLKLLQEFLNIENPEFERMSFLKAVWIDETKPEDWELMPPAVLLARHDLVHLLKTASKPKPEYSLSRFGRNRFMPVRKGVTSIRSPLNIGFDLDIGRRYSGGRTLLHNSAGAGSPAVTEFLLSCGARGDAYSNVGETPFFDAVEQNNVEDALLLIHHNQAFERRLDDKVPTSLHFAVLHDMEDVARHLLLRLHANPNFCSLDGMWTPVHVAAQTGSVEIIKMLLSANGAPDAKMTNGSTPLYLAAGRGHMGVLHALFSSTEAINPAPVTNDGITPLYAAAENGHEDAVALLFAKAAVVEPTAKLKRLPIHAAALNGHSPIVTRLLSPDSVAARDIHERTPLHLAASNGNLDIVKTLCEYGAKQVACPFEIDAMGRDLGIDQSLAPYYCVTPLCVAVTYGHLDVVKYLVNAGAATSCKMYFGATLLHLAGDPRSNWATFEYLHSKGLDPFALDIGLKTPFHEAASGGLVEIVNFYISLYPEQFDIDIADAYGHTALDNAATENRIDVITNLVSAGADCNTQDIGGRTPLMEACRLGREEILGILLRAGVDVNARETTGNTALHYAVYSQRPNVARVLLALPDIRKNERNRLGRTPLMAATERFDQLMIKVLLEGGVDPTVGYAASGSGELLPIGLPPTDESISPEEYQSQTDKLIRHLLKDLPSSIREEKEGIQDPRDRTAFWSILQDLSICFRRCKKKADHKICAEFYVTRMFDGQAQPNHECDWCQEYPTPLGPYYFCSNCPFTGICSKCNERRVNGELPKGCMAGHEYWEIGDTDWQKYPPRTVNSKGDTLEKWVADKKREYGVLE